MSQTSFNFSWGNIGTNNIYDQVGIDFRRVGDPRIWIFQKPPFERVYLDGENEILHKLPIDEQLDFLQNKIIQNWEKTSRYGSVESESAKEQNVLFGEVFTPFLVSTQVNKSNTMDIFKNFLITSLLSREKIENLERKCCLLKEEMVKSREYILSKMKDELDNQIKTFEEKIHGKYLKRKKKLEDFKEEEFEEKVKRGEIIPSTKEEPKSFRKLIMKCSDSLKVIFGYTTPSDLIRNISQSCSFFFGLVREQPLRLSLPVEILNSFPVERLLSKHNLVHLYLAGETFGEGELSLEKEILVEKSRLIEDHKHQLKTLKLPSSFVLSNEKTWGFSEEELNGLMERAKKIRKNFYDKVSMCKKLEFLSTSVLPTRLSDLKYLKNLQYDIFKSGSIIPTEFRNEMVQNLIDYFTAEKRTRLETIVFQEKGIGYGREDFDQPGEAKKLITELFIRISESCISLKVFESRVNFGFECFPDEFLEFITQKVQWVNIHYRGVNSQKVESLESQEILKKKSNLKVQRFQDLMRRRRIDEEFRNLILSLMETSDGRKTGWFRIHMEPNLELEWGNTEKTVEMECNFVKKILDSINLQPIFLMDLGVFKKLFEPPPMVSKNEDEYEEEEEENNNNNNNNRDILRETVISNVSNSFCGFELVRKISNTQDTQVGLCMFYGETKVMADSILLSALEHILHIGSEKLRYLSLSFQGTSMGWGTQQGNTNNYNSLFLSTVLLSLERFLMMKTKKEECCEEREEENNKMAENLESVVVYCSYNGSSISVKNMDYFDGVCVILEHIFQLMNKKKKGVQDEEEETAMKFRNLDIKVMIYGGIQNENLEAAGGGDEGKGIEKIPLVVRRVYEKLNHIMEKEGTDFWDEFSFILEWNWSWWKGRNSMEVLVKKGVIVKNRLLLAKI